MRNSANDAPLSPQAVDRAIALLRAGHTCKEVSREWSYVKQQDRYWQAEWVLKDNEWTGWYLTEEELRKKIAEHAAAFRDMLVAAL